MLNDPRRPLYLQIHDQLRSRIVAGEWTAGQALPSETALARQTGASQGTVRKALNSLAEARLIQRRQGVGTFIPKSNTDTNLTRFFCITDETGKKVEPELKSQVVKAVPAPQAAADALNIMRGRQVWRLDRLLALRNRAGIVQRVYLAANVTGFEDSEDPDIYEIIQRRSGHTMHRAEDFIRAACAPSRIAWMLDCTSDTPVLCVSRRAFDISGRCLEYSQSYIAPKEWGYSVSLK